MPCDYLAIRLENQKRYGTDIVRIGPMLLADRYDDRTHFIYELLQNAEDALARRCSWSGARAVRFELFPDSLRLSHYGRPFDERDVRGICGIAESTKGTNNIGRFGIGFKSVYAYTSRPEIHSGDEDFAVESFVLPTAAQANKRGLDETVIILPLDAAGADPAISRAEITRGLQGLGPGTLMFLREIEEIEWIVAGGPSGIYLRGKPDHVAPWVRRITLLGQEAGRADISESWIIFSREVNSTNGDTVGRVEIAFSECKTALAASIQPVADSPLVVYFPTVVRTNLGFLVQGPYRTTPSRDNVPKNDPWNQRLVTETASLLVDAFEWMRDSKILDVSALRCLPMDANKFHQGAMFWPLFDTVRSQLRVRRMLPTSSGGYVAASGALLARTQELRQLLTDDQLGQLFGAGSGSAWLSADISTDRTPEIRHYIMRELDVREVTPEMALSRLTQAFLEAQSDDWILRLYEFLQGQPALMRGGRLDDVAIVRLADGTHVTACENGQPNAFLPGPIDTAFPTVRKAVCASDPARKFLESIGLLEPDPVDDVVRNILPKYEGEDLDLSDDEYGADIRRILGAFRSDSKAQREKLIDALRRAHFVMSVKACDQSRWRLRPVDLYLATARLKGLFDGVDGVYIVDDEYDCLRGEEIRELLEACGASRSLQPVSVQPDFSLDERRELRIAGGCASVSGGSERFTDYTLRGLGELMDAMPKLDRESRAGKAALLWEALDELEERRGTGVFTGAYSWSYVHPRNTTFDSSFVRQLNNTAWIMDAQGDLCRPSDVQFDSLKWKSSPFLESKIRFKPPIIEVLAKEAGIDPGILSLLKKIGVTSEAELRARLGVPTAADTLPIDAEAAVEESSGPAEGGGGVTPNSETSIGGHCGTSTSNAPGPNGRPSGNGERNWRPHWAVGRSGAGKTHRNSSESASERVFISYVAIDPHEGGDEDPDGLDQQARMDLEESAIVLILKSDPRLQRTKTHNPGFDLFEADGSGQPIRWIEVKSMTGSLADRPVCLSQTQFDCAWVHGEDFWLYIVEYAGDSNRATILRIQDPAGKAKNFTFDRGWREIAAVVPETPRIASDLSRAHS